MNFFNTECWTFLSSRRCNREYFGSVNLYIFFIIQKYPNSMFKNSSIILINPVIFIPIDPNSWIIIHFLSFKSIDIAYDFLIIVVGDW